MSGFLLDTNIISMFAPDKPEVSTEFTRWLEARDHEGQLFLSVVAIHEIERGIALLRAKGATAKARALDGWLAGLVAAYGETILNLDPASAAVAGRLEAAALGAGHDPGMADALVAGIAQTHDLVVVSRNTKHFLPFGAKVVTPEEACGQS